MKLAEQRACADETLQYFIQAMPDTPFTESDIVFWFARKADMAKRAVELCALYCPERVLNDSQLLDLTENVAANAFAGRETSAILIRIDASIGKKDFRRIIVHELMHIFCAKLEMDGKHFIDIYGSGTTQDNPEDEVYDGFVGAGYKVWSEFIAQYYAVKLIDTQGHEFADIADFVVCLLSEVILADLTQSRDAFSMLCAYWLNCTDFEDTLAALDEPGTFIPENEPYGTEAQNALRNCLHHIHGQISRDKPWKICEEYICELGFKFSLFRTMNSFFLGFTEEK